ncbi:Fc.00g021670.m01.CDS01 [Cosmosporella sp. VM-42]
MSDDEKPTNNIFNRNKEGTNEALALLWRAFCDKPKTIHKYLTKDAILAEPDHSVYSQKTEPTLKEYIDDYEPWTAYKIHDDPKFVEIDMMSSAVLYRVTVWRLENGEMQGTEAMCSSVWRQGPGGDWRCCAHHMSEL